MKQFYAIIKELEALKEGEVMQVGFLTFEARMYPKQGTACRCCDNKRKGSIDMYRVTGIPSQPVVYVHRDCLRALKPFGNSRTVKGSSKRCINHNLDVIFSVDSVDIMIYLAFLGCKILGHGGYYRKGHLWVERKQQASKIAKWSLNKGLDVRVNDVSVLDYEEYKDITTRK